MTTYETEWDYRDPYVWMEKVGRSQLPPAIITAAVNGGFHGKEANIAVPETPEQIAEEAFKAYEAGASQIHIHGRDPEDWSQCTGNPEVYGKINELVREACPDVVINNSTGGGPTLTTEERYCPLDAVPAADVVTLNLGPAMSKFVMAERPDDIPHPRGQLEFDTCDSTTYGELNHYASVMKERGFNIEFEVYNSGQYWVLRDLIDNGHVKERFMVQFVLGVGMAAYPTPASLMSLVSELPNGAMFSVIGTGVYQMPMNVMGLVLGGHVRVGLEDNLYFKKGQKASGNAEMVSRIKRIAEDMNREVATPKQAREILGLNPVNIGS